MIPEPCELKSGLVRQICQCGCEGCYYENETKCPHDKCSTPDEEFIFVSSKGKSNIKNIGTETKEQVKKVKPLF